MFKKLITKWVIKNASHHITNKKELKHYCFWRFLASLVEREHSREIASVNVAVWTMKNENFKTFSIRHPYITDIVVVENIVYLITSEPGLCIGTGGKTIDDLDNYLKEHGYKVNIIEDTYTTISKFNYAKRYFI